MPIVNNFLVGATLRPSPNHSGLIIPKFIVMHYTAAWTVKGTLDRFADPASKVSAQITIDTDGTIYQHVPFNQSAWHAGPSTFGGYTGLNQYSIGIEHVNPGFLKKATGGYIDAYGSFKTEAEVGPVVESACPRAGSGTFFWPLYPEAQLAASARLVKDLLAAYPILNIVTHEEIDTRGWKTDPGPAFPMARYRALLGDRVKDSISYTVTSSTLNVRSGPGTNFNVVQTLRSGDGVRVMEKKEDWVRISSDGWVHSSFLRVA